MHATRFVLMFSVVVAGCGKGKPPSDAPDKIAPAAKVATDSLPVPTATLRTKPEDLYSFYYPPTDGVFKKHPHEGKRITIKTSGRECWGIEATKGERLVVEGFEKGYRRPHLVYRLRDAHGFTKGEFPPGDLYFEGVLQGPTSFDTKRWAKDWVNLSEQYTAAKSHFIYIDGAIITSAPKD